jgi:hypothetical protein
MKGAGVVTVLIVAGGVWRAYGQGVFSVGKGPAYEPWKNWRSASNAGSLSLVASARRNSVRQPAQHAAVALQGNQFLD